MKELSIDLETYSDVDISKCGAYKYAESDNFEILLFGVSVDGEPVKVYDLACGDTVPEEILAALSDDNVTKWAFNASFERICLSNWLKRHHPEYFYGYSIPEDPASKYLDPSAWKCTMIWSAYMGLPLSLEGVGAVLKLQDQKLKEGKDLIRYFCTPCKPTKANGGRTRNLPQHDSEKWIRFKEYNRRDVEVEMAIKKRLTKYPVPEQMILPTMEEMEFIRYEGKGYQPIYTRTELTDALHEAFGFCTSKQIIPTKKMRNICSVTKKPEKPGNSKGSNK